MSSAKSALTHGGIAALSGALTAWFVTKRHEADIERHEPSAVSVGTPTSPISVFRPNADLEIAFDARTRNPLFVVERLGGRNQHGGDTARRKGKQFHEETKLRPEHRSRNAAFHKSGYDRGHLAPAADFRHDDDAMAATFSLCNVSPQVASLNRKSWLRLESLARRVAREEWDGAGRDTYVVSGPLWLPSKIVPSADPSVKDKYQFVHHGIGSPPSIVFVPTHFFKVIAVADGSSASGRPPRLTKFAAFVLPNREVNTPAYLSEYLVRVTDLEAVSGMSFFPALFAVETGAADFGARALADLLTESVWLQHAGRANDGAAAIPIGTADVGKKRRQHIRDMLKNEKDLPFEHICRSSRRECNIII